MKLINVNFEMMGDFKYKKMLLMLLFPFFCFIGIVLVFVVHDVYIYASFVAESAKPDRMAIFEYENRRAKSETKFGWLFDVCRVELQKGVKEYYISKYKPILVMGSDDYTMSIAAASKELEYAKRIYPKEECDQVAMKLYEALVEELNDYYRL